MTFRSDEQLEAIRRFHGDYFPTLSAGIVSKDIVKAMKEDLALIVADPVVPLAVAVHGEVPLGNNAAQKIPPVDPFEEHLEQAVELVGIRDEEPKAEPNA